MQFIKRKEGVFYLKKANLKVNEFNCLYDIFYFPLSI